MGPGKGRLVHGLRGCRCHTKGAAISPDGQRSSVEAGCGTVCLWDLQAGRELRRFDDDSGWTDSVAFSPDGSRVLTGGLCASCLCGTWKRAGASGRSEELRVCGGSIHTRWPSCRFGMLDDGMAREFGADMGTPERRRGKPAAQVSGVTPSTAPPEKKAGAKHQQVECRRHGNKAAGEATAAQAPPHRREHLPRARCAAAGDDTVVIRHGGS